MHYLIWSSWQLAKRGIIIIINYYPPFADENFTHLPKFSPLILAKAKIWTLLRLFNSKIYFFTTKLNSFQNDSHQNVNCGYCHMEWS